MRTRSTWALPLFLFGSFAACGDNHDDPHPDARRQIDAAIDAPVAVCNYTETSDATNDAFWGNTPPNAAEPTNLNFTGPKLTICGKLDTGHYADNTALLVDTDVYQLTVPAQKSALISFTAPGAEALDTVLIEIYSDDTGADGLGQFIGTFAVGNVELPPASDYTFLVSAYHSAASTAAIDYHLSITMDEPTTRCPKSTATASYIEALEGSPVEGGNDIYEVHYGTATPRNFTALPTDVVEPTGITAAPNGKYRVTGIITDPTAKPVSQMDDYMDRDTYQIATGANTNQLTLRLNWPGTNADLDFLVFPMATLNDFADAYANQNTEDEFLTFAVAPSTTYWVFVGADDLTTGQPITYDLSVCGATFTP